jgi:hypothetical protein
MFANFVQISGDIFITLDKLTKTANIWNLEAMKLIQIVDLKQSGNFTEFGTLGFEIIKHGNAYNVLFSATEQVPVLQNETNITRQTNIT